MGYRGNDVVIKPDLATDCAQICIRADKLKVIAQISCVKISANRARINPGLENTPCAALRIPMIDQS